MCKRKGRRQEELKRFFSYFCFLFNFFIIQTLKPVNVSDNHYGFLFFSVGVPLETPGGLPLPRAAETGVTAVVLHSQTAVAPKGSILAAALEKEHRIKDS